MEKAYVLLNVEIDAEKEVLNALEDIHEVTEEYQIYGVYDFIIRVEDETLQELKDLVEKRVRGIGKIRSTLTLICI